jgi:alpha-tubulin suppressor-like RCC1 family protein
MAIRTDGSLWAWGNNVFGQLGDGTRVSSLDPIKIMEDVVAVSAGWNHSMAIRADGSLWAWGINSTLYIYDRGDTSFLGDGTTIDRLAPVRIMDDVAAVSTGYNHTMVIRTDGSLWAWGYNNWGQLGDGTMENQSTPVRIMEDVAAVSVGTRHTVAVKTDGSLWVWGHNYFGQLGDSTLIDRHTPVRIMDNIAYASAGADFTMVIRTDGSLWAWGYDIYGQLGDGASTNRFAPERIMEDVVAVSTNTINSVNSNAYGHVLAVRRDGSLWAWGCNTDGQVGDGTIINRTAPIQIMDSVMVTDNMLIRVSDSNLPDIPALPNIANPLTSAVIINGRNVEFQAYSIDGQNFFRMRDIAHALNNTSARVSMGYNGRNHTITQGRIAGTDPGLLRNRAGALPAIPTTFLYVINGSEVVFDTYRIGNCYFFLLCDIEEHLNIVVTWDEEANEISIKTSSKTQGRTQDGSLP